MELEGSLAPIKCDDEGPDFSKMGFPSKGEEKAPGKNKLEPSSM
jgi:hypothetical protein